MLSHCAGDTVQSCLKDQIYMHTMTSYRRFNLYITRLLFCYDIRTEQNRTDNLFVKTCTYIHHHTKHVIQLYMMLEKMLPT